MTTPNNYDWQALRAQLRKRRMDLGLTQTEVATKINRSQDFIAVFENHPTSVPNLATIMLWANALGGTIKFEWKGSP